MGWQKCKDWQKILLDDLPGGGTPQYEKNTKYCGAIPRNFVPLLKQMRGQFLIKVGILAKYPT